MIRIWLLEATSPRRLIFSNSVALPKGSCLPKFVDRLEELPGVEKVKVYSESPTMKAIDDPRAPVCVDLCLFLGPVCFSKGHINIELLMKLFNESGYELGENHLLLK